MIFEYYQKYQDNRDIFLPLEEIRIKAKGKKDAYCSIFGYDSKNILHGDIYSGMYFDFDREGKIEEAYSDVKTLLEIFSFYKISNKDYQLCFSGYKGFHLTIHPVVMGIKPQSDLDKIYKQIAKWFFVQLPYRSLDFKVYERRRLWRVINTINGKSGLYKISITGKETIVEILKKAKSPQPVKQIYPTLNPVAKEWIPRALQEIEQGKLTPKVKLVSCHYEKNINDSVMLQIKNGVSKGERNNTAFFIACYLRAKGFSENNIELYLFEFGSKCNPQLGQREIASVIRSAFNRSL